MLTCAQVSDILLCGQVLVGRARDLEAAFKGEELAKALWALRRMQERSQSSSDATQGERVGCHRGNGDDRDTAAVIRLLQGGAGAGEVGET